jgi:hypothetical protein
MSSKRLSEVALPIDESLNQGSSLPLMPPPQLPQARIVDSIQGFGDNTLFTDNLSSSLPAFSDSRVAIASVADFLFTLPVCPASAP